jgi:hypothetical protein
VSRRPVTFIAESRQSFHTPWRRSALAQHLRVAELPRTGWNKAGGQWVKRQGSVRAVLDVLICGAIIRNVLRASYCVTDYGVRNTKLRTRPHPYLIARIDERSLL